MNETDPVLMELREQTRLLRLIAMPELKRLVRELLKDDAEKLAFDLSDGARSTRDVADAVGVSSKTISNWWQKWSSAGIATTDSKGRATRITSLASIGVSMPKLGAGESQVTGTNEESVGG